ncbi:MAG: SRPBCC family protein [Pseudomonadota bacterium]
MANRLCAQTWVWLSLLCSSALVPVVNGGEVISVRVHRHAAIYDIAIEAQIEAPPQSVYALLTDYANLSRINPSIIESRVIEQYDEHAHRIEMITRLCVLFYCKDLKQTQDMYRGEDGLLTARLIPHGSDFNGGSAKWQLSKRQGGTYLLFDASLEPDYWIPPLIGPLLLRHMFYREAVNTVAGLERLYKKQRDGRLE